MPKPFKFEECMMPTLHVIGKDDNVIGTMSDDLLPVFGTQNAEVLYHSGGHFVPAGTKTEKPKYIDFLTRMKEKCYQET